MTYSKCPNCGAIHSVERMPSDREEVRNLPCLTCRVRSDYARYGFLPALIAEHGGTVTDTAFADEVTLSFYLPARSAAAFSADLTERSAGRLTMETTGECFAPAAP